MDLMLVIKAIIALSAIGLLAAAVLSVASKRFYVETDPRVDAVLDLLPGSNCGACGNPSCFIAAEAIASGEAEVTTCTAGGQTVSDAVAEVMGVEKCAVGVQVMLRHCGGGKAAYRSFDYAGVMTCAAAVKVAGGDLACPYGCLGYGDCARACPFGAITMDARGLPVVDLDKCTGCEVCVAECPRGGITLLEMVAEDAPIAVRCNSHDKVKARKEYCSMCCTSCRKCEKACPHDAIHVIDMLAVVDYEKCTGCGICVDVCPQECIDLTGRTAMAPATELDGRGPKVDGFEPKEVVGSTASLDGSTGDSTPDSPVEA